MTDKIRLNIFFPPEFIPIVKAGMDILTETQKDHFRFFLNKIPHPYSMGNEIQFRFEEYKQLKLLLKEIIEKFIPYLEQEKYVLRIPVSPIEFLTINGYGDQKNL